MSKYYFVTGTDTDVGKTFCACVVTSVLRKNGLTVRPYKPVVAGFENGENADLTSHIAASGISLNPMDITAYAFEEPIAPHIASMKQDIPITFSGLDAGLIKAEESNADVIITEGAGGWMLPVSQTEVLPSWPSLKKMEIIVVVGMKLGCLNHALLTVNDIRSRGYRIKGFIANTPGPQVMPYYEENLDTLKGMLDCPFLGEVFYEPAHSFTEAGHNLNEALLIG